MVNSNLMAPKVLRRRNRGKRRNVVSHDRVFYPGEVVRILGLRGIDYRQLRELFLIVTNKRKVDGWSKYEFRDLVGLCAAIELLGGKEVLKKKRERLRIKYLKEVCTRLRNNYGVDQPLSEVRLERIADEIVVRLKGHTFEPVTGQRLFSFVTEAVRGYFRTSPDRGQKKSLKDIESDRVRMLKGSKARPKHPKRIIA